MYPYIALFLLMLMPFFLQAGNVDDRIIIEAYGGSSTAGVIAVRKDNGRLKNVITRENEVQFLQDYLQQKYGKAVEVINKGQPSAQAIELLKGTYRYKNNGNWADEMKKSKAKLIILNFATNDARHFHFNDTKPDYVLSPDRYEKVMTEIITIARDNGKEVILQEPHPLCGKAKKWNISPYSERLNAISKNLSVPLVKQYQRIQRMPEWQSDMSPDCIHPSPALYKIKAEESYKVIEDNFSALLTGSRS